MEVSLIFLVSCAKQIDDNLQKLVGRIESQIPSLSVFSARQLFYNLRQNCVEITIQEPRQFNVLEEFIIRAGIEFAPPPTADELASILGLDMIFVQSTIATLQKLQTLEVKSPITVTAEGRTFFSKGTVLQPPYAAKIYAIADPLIGKITFQSQPLNETQRNPSDLEYFININNEINDISDLTLEELQQIIQNSDLELHTSNESKIITAFRVLPPIQTICQQIALLVIFDQLADKLSIQVRNDQQVLELTSNTWEVIADQLWVNALQNRDFQLATEILCIWNVLGMEELALTAIQQNSWMELLPVWLNVILQGLRSKNLSADSASFKTALSLLNQVTGEEGFIEELRTGWHEVIGAIATHNFQSALNLLNNQVWADFLRLDIVQDTDSPEKFISQHTTPPSQSKETQVKKKKSS
jgi:hypothetical protein